MIAKHTTAAEMALTIGADPNAFREALHDGASWPSLSPPYPAWGPPSR